MRDLRVLGIIFFLFFKSLLLALGIFYDHHRWAVVLLAHFIYLLMYLYIHLFISYLPAHRSVDPSTYFCISLALYPPVHLIIYLSYSLPIYQSIYPSPLLFSYLSIYLLIYLPISSLFFHSLYVRVFRLSLRGTAIFRCSPVDFFSLLFFHSWRLSERATDNGVKNLLLLFESKRDCRVDFSRFWFL